MKKKYLGGKGILIIVTTIISVLLILISIYIFFYPKYKIDKYYKEEKKDIVNFLEKIEKTEEYNKEKGSEHSQEEHKDAQGVTERNYSQHGNEVCSVLYIPKISLEKAVYSGDNDYNLSRYRLVEGLIDMTLGETCYVIFGHDSYNKGASFSRLGELGIGADVFLKYEGGERQYTVSAIDSVKSEDVINLINYDNADVLYLVTCEKKKVKGESDYRRHVLTCYIKY